MTPEEKYFDAKFKALDNRLASGDKRFDRFDKRFDELQKYAEALTLHLDRHKTVWKVMAVIGTVVSFVMGLVYQKQIPDSLVTAANEIVICFLPAGRRSRELEVNFKFTFLYSRGVAVGWGFLINSTRDFPIKFLY